MLPELVETPSAQIGNTIPVFCECVAAVVKRDSEWSGTTSELLQEIETVAKQRRLDTSSDPQWPSDAVSLWLAYQTYEDFLATLGVFRKKGVRPQNNGRDSPAKTSVANRLSLFVDPEAAARRPNGAGSVSLLDGTYWVGHWHIDGTRVTRCLGHSDTLSRDDAEALLVKGPPERKQRPHGAGSLSIVRSGGFEYWTAAWMIKGRTVARSLGRVDRMTCDDAEALVSAGPAAPKYRKRGTGTVRASKYGKWTGIWANQGRRRCWTLGRIDEMSREEAEAKLQQLIAESKGTS